MEVVSEHSPALFRCNGARCEQRPCGDLQAALRRPGIRYPLLSLWLVGNCSIDLFGCADESMGLAYLRGFFYYAVTFAIYRRQLGVLKMLVSDPHVENINNHQIKLAVRSLCKQVIDILLTSAKVSSDLISAGTGHDV